MRENLRRTRVLVGLAAGVPGVVLGAVAGATIDVLAGVVVALVVFAVAAAYVLKTSFRLALRLVGARPIHEGARLALVNQVEGLCATIGVAQPALYVVEDPVPNSCALAGAHDASALVVTTGLLERLGAVELEGALAHELVHLKRRDASVSAIAVSISAVLARVTAGRMPTQGAVHVAVGRGREYAADQAAALAVRYPPGLRDALAACEASPPEHESARSPFVGWRWAASRWIWLDPMVGDRDRVEGELDATSVRSAALAEL